MTRSAEIDAFLAAQGWSGARRAPLAGDASARRYERVTRGKFRALVMDVPPDSGLQVAPFCAVAAWLHANGLSAPRIFGADSDRGLLLVEDLGDALFAGLCARQPAREPALYHAAIDLLADLQTLALPGTGGGWSPPPYDLATLLREALLLVEWYLPAATCGDVAPDLAAEYRALAATAFTPLLATRPVAVLRDYHAENLIWLPRRTGHARIGLLDFQDMLIGHPAYDLASLLGDARRDVSPPLALALLERYLARTGADRDEFKTAARLLGAQRNLKILGLFTRLSRRDGKPRYLAYLPRVWANLQADLGHPALAPLAGWISRHVPAPERMPMTGPRRKIAGAAS